MHWKTQFAIAYKEKGSNELIVTGKKIGGVVIANGDRVQRTPLTFVSDNQFSNVQKKLDHVLLITYFINNKKHQAIFIFYGAFLLCGANRKLNDLSMICFSYKTAYLTLCDTIWLLWFGWCLHSVILQYQSIGGPSAFMLLQWS